MDRIPDYGKYSINELYEALNRLEKGLYPERVKAIQMQLEQRENQYLPEDYSTGRLLALRKKMVKEGIAYTDDLQKLDAEIKRRQDDPDYANRSKPAYTKGRINWKMIALALVVMVGLGAIVSLLAPQIPPDASVVQDALFLAQRSASSNRLIGDSLHLEGMPSGTLTEQQEGWISTGNADISIPVKGDSGSGVILVKGKLGKKGWDFSRLDLQPTGSDSMIALLPELFQTAGIDTSTVE